MIVLEPEAGMWRFFSCYAYQDGAEECAPYTVQSATISWFPFQLGHIVFDFRFFQEIDARPLLASDGAAEFGDEETGIQRFGESPSGLQSPLPSQRGIFSFDLDDVARNFKRNSLAIQRGSEVGPGR